MRRPGKHQDVSSIVTDPTKKTQYRMIAANPNRRVSFPHTTEHTPAQNNATINIPIPKYS
jgi:hypothetical protein